MALAAALPRRLISQVQLSTTHFDAISEATVVVQVFKLEKRFENDRNSQIEVTSARHIREVEALGVLVRLKARAVAEITEGKQRLRAGRDQHVKRGRRLRQFAEISLEAR